MKSFLTSTFLFLMLLTSCTENQSVSVETAKTACICASSNQDSEGVRNCIKEAIKANKQNLEVFYDIVKYFYINDKVNYFSILQTN